MQLYKLIDGELVKTTTSVVAENVVYIPAHTRLGDTIIGINNAIHISKKKGEKINYCFHPKILKFNEQDKKYAMGTFFDMLELFNYNDFLNIVDHKEDCTYTYLGRLPYSEFDNFRITQENIQENKICFHFTPRSRKRKKAPDENQKIKLIETLQEKFEITLDCQEFASQNGLRETVKMMSTCKCFVGVCSGFSHIAHCIKIPTHLIYFSNPRSIISWHKKQKYIRYNTDIEFLEKFTV